MPLLLSSFCNGSLCVLYTCDNAAIKKLCEPTVMIVWFPNRFGTGHHALYLKCYFQNWVRESLSCLFTSRPCGQEMSNFAQSMYTIYRCLRQEKQKNYDCVACGKGTIPGQRLVIDSDARCRTEQDQGKAGQIRGEISVVLCLIWSPFCQSRDHACDTEFKCFERTT